MSNEREPRRVDLRVQADAPDSVRAQHIPADAGVPDALIVDVLGLDGAVVAAASREARDSEIEALDVLHHRGLVAPEQVAAIQALHHGLPVIDLRLIRPDIDVSHLVPVADCRRLGCVPVDVRGDEIVVATARPSGALRRQLEELLGRPVSLHVATHDEIRLVIEAVAGTAYDGLSDDAPDPLALIVSEAQRWEASRLQVRTARDSAATMRLRVNGSWGRWSELPATVARPLARTLDGTLPRSSGIAETFDVVDLETLGGTVVAASVTAMRGVRDLVVEVPAAHPTTLNSLGIDADAVDELRRVLDRPSGLVLVTGPVDAALPLVLDAVVDEVDAPARLTAVVAPHHLVSTDGALRLRALAEADVLAAIAHAHASAADVIVVGEVSTAPVAHALLDCVDDGRLVVASFHSVLSNPGRHALERFGIATEELRGHELAVVNVRQVRNACASCRAPHQPSASLLDDWSSLGGDPVGTFVHGYGCAVCADTGFVDRTFVAEVSVARPHQAPLLLTDSLAASARGLVARQVTTVGEVVRRLALVGEQAS
jgi:hypothetical protein